MAEFYTKDPNAKLDYRIDWSAWLETDTIVTSTWAVPDGLTKVSDSHTTTTSTVWLSGGTLEASYTVVNHIVTAAGRENDHSFFILIQNK
jgi:hypothetical protein